MSSPRQPPEAPARRPLRAPDRSLQLLEPRALFEMGAMVASAPVLRAMGRGDAHPVLVLPGFTAGDDSTVPLRALIRSWGYWAHGWRLGANFGPTPSVLAALRERLDELHDRHGATVSVVGWSLGGLYARHLARLAPDKVRQVITLGSPLQMMNGDRSSASRLRNPVQSQFDPTFGVLPDHRQGVLPVPSTSVYTKTDGVVRWQICLDVADERHENIQVRGSHSGLGFNPAVVYVVANRLSQPEGSWHPFRPPFPLGGLYPQADSWRS